MSLKLKDLKEMHERAYQYGQVNRQQASDDMVFKFVTQWDDDMIEDFLGSYRGEFDILTKAIRKIVSDLMLNPVQVEFEPLGETSDEAASVIDGVYITDDGRNTSFEAYENAEQECIVCGVGAWELGTEYVSIRGDDKRQRVIRTPLYEANNNVFWDPNAKRQDKSDATFCSVLESYTPEAYKLLHEELTGEEAEEVNPSSFEQPETSYTFPWIGGQGERVYIVKFFHSEEKKLKVLTMIDPFGQEKQLKESDLGGVMDDMIDEGFQVVEEKMVEFKVVTQYIASGREILDETVIACEYIPIIPMYGEYASIEGEFHYEGAVRRAKDPARLRNFALSYLGSIVQTAPKEKNIYYQEQIAGLERYHEQSGAEDNFPYALVNRVATDGATLPNGPIGKIPAAQIPPALTELTAQAKEAVTDVADPGIPQNVADVDISGKAVMALQAELDKQSMIYQQHRKHAKRRDAEVYASFMTHILDIPQEVVTTSADGTRTKTKVMDSVFDAETGDIVTLNDVRDSQFEIFTKIGPSYSSKREKSLEMLSNMVQNIDPGDPMRRAIQLKQMALMDSFDFKDIREYANKQLVLSGFKEPETDEEKAMYQEAQQQPKEPDANMVLAQAEMLKGQAQMKEQQLKQAQMQLDAMDKKGKLDVSVFEAQTDRMNTQIDAKKAGADISVKQVESYGKQLDNALKFKDLRAPRIQSNTQSGVGEQMLAGIQARRDGGPVEEGVPYLMGEDGREIMVGNDGSKTIVGRNGAEIVVPEDDGTVIPNKEIKDYGFRASGEKKGPGFMGELKRPDGDISTELSIGVDFGRGNMEIPLLVPTLTKEEVKSLLSGERGSNEMVDKAIRHAIGRIESGKSPFLGWDEQQATMQ